MISTQQEYALRSEVDRLHAVLREETAKLNAYRALADAAQAMLDAEGEGYYRLATASHLLGRHLRACREVDPQ